MDDSARELCRRPSADRSFRRAAPHSGIRRLRSHEREAHRRLDARKLPDSGRAAPRWATHHDRRLDRVLGRRARRRLGSGRSLFRPVDRHGDVRTDLPGRRTNRSADSRRRADVRYVGCKRQHLRGNHPVPWFARDADSGSRGARAHARVGIWTHQCMDLSDADEQRGRPRRDRNGRSLRPTADGSSRVAAGFARGRRTDRGNGEAGNPSTEGRSVALSTV